MIVYVYYTYVYIIYNIYIYSSVNPCISMHDAKRNRVQWLRAERNRGQHFRIVISNSSLKQPFRARVVHRRGPAFQCPGSSTWWSFTDDLAATYSVNPCISMHE